MIKRIGKIIISGIISVMILSVFCIAFGYSGVHILNPSGATDYMWEPNQLRTTMTEGLAWFRMDKYGFNNGADVDPLQPNILLMGSSHMEAAAMDDSENAAYLLNEMIEDKSTYNIGISGHTIIRCVNNMENAVNFYNPKEYIILETNTIFLPEDEMITVLEDKYEIIPSYNSGILAFLQTKLPAIKSIYKSIQDWSNNVPMNKADNTGLSSTKSEVSITYADTLAKFLRYASDSSKGRQLIIFYHPLTSIDEDGEMVNSTNADRLLLFKSICDNEGIIFVDMTEPFNKLYKNEHKLAHGFINTGVGSGHLNKYGHRVIAEELTSVIKNDMEDANVTQ